MLDLDADGAQLIDGPAGVIEVLVDRPGRSYIGAAVVAHPHPLLGGNARHKVPQFLARGLAGARSSAQTSVGSGAARARTTQDRERLTICWAWRYHCRLNPYYPGWPW